ncbi:MAG: hypothetical protein HY903_13150 [Deltaproteobacteria bacterium]|nr:hypothetical protein [Deltaproteobacteria bacterium]
MVDGISDFGRVLDAAMLEASTKGPKIDEGTEYRALATAIERRINKAVPGAVKTTLSVYIKKDHATYKVFLSDNLTTVKQAETIAATARAMLHELNLHLKDKPASARKSAADVEFTLMGLISDAEERAALLKARPVEDQLRDYIDKGVVPNGKVKEPFKVKP